MSIKSQLSTSIFSEKNCRVYEKLNFFLKTKSIPHIIFHGEATNDKQEIVNRFINNIYNHDKNKIKTNVMFINCAHGKGIRFIREELKIFARTNIQCNSDILFKTIVLNNAEFLTIDAQTALRRCIELFSYNTRFFIIVENKHKLLIPIISRFCEIYIPEMENTKIIKKNNEDTQNFILQKIESVKWKKIEDVFLEEFFFEHPHFIKISNSLYDKGISCLDIINYLQEKKRIITLQSSKEIIISFDNEKIIELILDFYNIKSEFRCEKLLMLYIFDFLFFAEEINTQYGERL